MPSRFSQEELEAIRQADIEIDAEFGEDFELTEDELRLSEELEELAKTSKLSDEDAFILEKLRRRKGLRTLRQSIHYNQDPRYVIRNREYMKVHDRFNERSGDAQKKKNADQCRKWREVHQEEVLEYKRKYRQEHKEELLAYQRAYYNEHKAERAAYMKKWRAEHREQIQEQTREYRQKQRQG